MWVFGASATSSQPWSKEAAEFACEGHSAKEATFLTMATAPFSGPFSGDLYRHQSRAGPQKHENPEDVDP